MTIKKVLLILMTSLFISGTAVAGDLLLEDINFPYDSAGVVDDLKQIPQIVDVLNRHSAFLLDIKAHADYIGSNKYNQKLSLARAESVKAIFVDQGIAPSRIHIVAMGETHPKSKDKNVDGRFINRRATFSIYEMKDGNKYYYYKDNEMVRAIEGEKPLDLQPVASAEDMEEIKNRLKGIEDRTEGLAKAEDLNALKDKLDKIEKQQMFDETRVSVLAAGGTYNDDDAGIAEGKFFLAFNDRLALQVGISAGLNYLLKDYQLDFGIIANHDRFQAGAFTSASFIRPKGMNDTASISQFSLTAAFLLDGGSIGVFFTKGLEQEDTIQTTFTHANRTIITDTVIEVQDKIGFAIDYYVDNMIAVEAEVGIVDASDKEVFGRIKLGYPLAFISDKLLFFVQGSYNNSLIVDEDDIQVVAGIEIGNWFFKKPASEDIRPMHIADVSYEMFSRDRPENETP